ncbi:lysophospholipid acyltransferase family protein [Bacillus fonticola]|uniref:lysophospholipid acyltransferase family protein n=1 Tax=Bacillus fonticola TaxID=2728853 RepID=UPI001475883C|nr:lysophospholipid acyltransferase family protein [Bacillus fonticola]
MSFYHFARSIVAGVMKPIFRFKVIGSENFPKEGGVLLCCNHISNLDPPALGVAAPRPVSYMAKQELFEAPILKTVLPKVHAFPVRRGKGDREALRTGLKALKEGAVLGLFPEGTRSKDGQIQKALAGAGFFALRSEAAIVPCAIIGPYKPFSRLKIVFGKPIDFESYRTEKISAEEATSIIMEEIQHLLDEQRGSRVG